MKKRFVYLLALAFLALIQARPSSVYAAADTVFREFYAYEKNEYTYGDFYQIDRLQLIDAEAHIYMRKSRKTVPGRYTTIKNAGGDAYDVVRYSKKYTAPIFSGVLNSDTAAVTAVRDLRCPNAQENIDAGKARCLPEDMDSSYQHIAKTVLKPEWDKSFDKEDPSAFTAYTASQGCSQGLGAEVYQVVVKDQGVETVCTVITPGSPMNYSAFAQEGKWEKNGGSDAEGQNSDWSGVCDALTLYDGTDGDSEELPVQRQFGAALDWKSADYISGVDVESGRLLERGRMEIPSDVKSVRVSYDCQMEESRCAAFLGLPGNTSQGINTTTTSGQIEKMHNYFYYRNKVHMASINGGEWHDVKVGEPSPELPLRKGLNYIYLAGTDKTQAQEARRCPAEMDLLSYVILFHWDGEEGYEPTKGGDAGIKKVELYQGALSELEAVKKFKEIPAQKDEDGNWVIDMHASEPHVWVNAVLEDPAATWTMEGATPYMGGRFARLDSSKDYFEITAASADGQAKEVQRIGIRWTQSSAQLSDLKVKRGGALEAKYDPDTKSYYCEPRGAASSLTLTYATAANSKTEVLVDRVKRDEVETKDEPITRDLTVDVGVHEIQWKVTAAIGGKKATYHVYLERGAEEGISEKTRQRAKAMIDKLVTQGNYKRYLTETYGGNQYWKTFGAAAIGEEYLDGLLGYDVTAHNYKQATDWAAVILELIMSGENPYDYLGKNYVDGLMEYNGYNGEEGNFGPYTANIWALSALQAAGAPIPEGTVERVCRTAFNAEGDLDTRGWALYAISPYKELLTGRDYAWAVQSLKERQVQEAEQVNGVNVTGIFDHPQFAKNSMTHGCVTSGLTALGIDAGSAEFLGSDGSDAVSPLENYQTDKGMWFRLPENKNGGSFNKDTVIAVGDLYNGSNVYQRYYLTPDRYAALLSRAEELLNGQVKDEGKRQALREAYEKAGEHAGQTGVISVYGREYYALQDAYFAANEGARPNVFLGNLEEKGKVTAVKEAIASIASYSYADKGKLDGMKEQYDALGQERLRHYVTNAEALDEAYAYVAQIDDFLAKTQGIGSVNPSKAAKIQAVRELYESLSDRQRKESAVAKAHQTLQKAEKALASARTADKVSQAIECLGEAITLDSQEDIRGVRAAYDALTQEAQARVANLEKLTRAEEKLASLLKTEEAIEKAQAVRERIEAIGRVSQNSREAIEKAREAYDALTQEAQRFVGAYPALVDAEAAYQNLISQNELDDALSMAVYQIQGVEDAWGGLAQVDESNQEALTQAVQAAEESIAQQEGKHPQFRALIENYPALTQARGELAAYEIAMAQDVTEADLESAVSQIGDASSLDAEEAIRRAEAIYERLQPESPPPTYERLEESRARLNLLKAHYADIQKFSYGAATIGQISFSSGPALRETQSVYEAMDEETRGFLDGSLVQTFLDAQAAYGELEDKKLAADQTDEAIRQAAEAADAESLTAARAAYEALEYKELAAALQTLTQAEARLEEARRARHGREMAAAVSQRIAGLASATYADAQKIQEAREAYDALLDSQKEFVENRSVLEAAEARVKAWREATVTIQPASVTIQVKKSAKLKARISAGAEIITDMKVTWKSDAPSVAAVKDGAVTGRKAGTATIQATLPNGKKATCKVTVQAAPKLTLNSGRATVYASGEKHTYRLKAALGGKSLAASKVKWESGAPSVATVSRTGVVTGRSRGTATIRATYQGQSVTCKVTVKSLTRKLKRARATLRTKGKARKLTLVLKENGSKIPAGRITWRSNRKSVATVSKKGVVTAKRKGTVTIKATYKGKTYTCKVKVAK